jgi:hypothetical protein
MDAMENEVISQAEADERILTFDVPDETLERTTSAEQKAFPAISERHAFLNSNEREGRGTVPQTNVLFTANQGRTWHSSGESAKPVILDLLVRPRQSRHILRNAVARFRCILYNRRVSGLGVIFCRCQHKQDKKLLSAHDIWDTRFCLASLPPIA